MQENGQQCILETFSSCKSKPHLKKKFQKHLYIARLRFHYIIFYCFTDTYVNMKVHIYVVIIQ